MASLSYVWPSAVHTGFTIISRVIGHKNDNGGSLVAFATTELTSLGDKEVDILEEFRERCELGDLCQRYCSL